MISPQPFGLRPPNLPLEKPHRDKRMYVNERKAPILRNQPCKSRQKESCRKRPCPIALRALTPAEIEKQAESDDKGRVPQSGQRSPTPKTPKPVSARKIQRNISRRQNEHAADPDRIVNG